MKTENEKSEVEIIIMRCYNYRATSGKRYLTTSIIQSHKLGLLRKLRPPKTKT